MCPSDVPRGQYNVQLPEDLADEVRREAHRLSGHRRRGFSDLITILARYGWDAYQRGDLEIGREPRVISYRLVRSQGREDT